MLRMINTDTPQDDIKSYLLDYIRIIDKTNDNWYYRQFEELMPKILDINFIKNLSIIQAPFESSCLEDLRVALKYTGTNFKEKLHDPLSATEIINEIAVGYIYFFRMVHIAEEKLAARGIGAYARRTLQP